ncbi:MAG: hypothetical protein EBZ51_13365 [Synechococcaceae bacterium WB9_2_112]|nr:hypothetical protein [Synechococcaceae bacterium WB9_2_112]
MAQVACMAQGGIGLPHWWEFRWRGLLELALSSPMPLIPRWRFMTDEAKAITKRVAVSALAVLVVLLVLRSLLPWVLLGLIAWWTWRALNR